MGDFPVNPLVLIGVGSSFAFSGLFYHLYGEKKKELEKLKEIPVFKPDQHLVQTLNASPRRRLQYVAVEGLVQADGEPLASQFVPRCFGVVQKIVEEEHWKYWNAMNRSWDSEVNRKETNNAVPFSLVRPGSHLAGLRVEVQSPLEASGSYLERIHAKVRHAEGGVVSVALQDIAGEKPVAMEESEELLREGSPMTGFGEVVLDGDGAMRLRPPHDGRKYILVSTDHRSFMDGHERTASMWKTLTAVTGLTGTSVLAAVVYGLAAKRDGNSERA